MRTSEVLQAWKKILQGESPSLSIEITRECPLRCPGCYAYGSDHLGGGVTLRELSDYKGQELVSNIMQVVDRYRPLHLSLVGGDPLVRYRELEQLVPLVTGRGIHLQIVTSAFRPFPLAWTQNPLVNVVVSIDGLQPEHDVRRTPATYQRILANLAGHKITVHCTITSQMMKRSAYLSEFVEFWSAKEEIRKIWFSIFTPQVGESLPEILTPGERAQVIADLTALRGTFPKIDMPLGMLQQFAAPPSSPKECVFAQTTTTISADLTTVVTPCQFGGKPDCSQCGCIASMGLAAVGDHKLGGVIRVKSIFDLSLRIGRARSRCCVSTRLRSRFKMQRVQIVVVYFYRFQRRHFFEGRFLFYKYRANRHVLRRRENSPVIDNAAP
jgi:organic radical activating enzyme